MFCSILVFQVRDMLSSRVIEDIYEAFQGVRATSDTTLKTSDTGISNQRQANRMRR